MWIIFKRCGGLLQRAGRNIHGLPGEHVHKQGIWHGGNWYWSTWALVSVHVHVMLRIGHHSCFVWAVVVCNYNLMSNGIVCNCTSGARGGEFKNSKMHINMVQRANICYGRGTYNSIVMISAKPQKGLWDETRNRLMINGHDVNVVQG